ncbi:MAG TPA: hypothetical protein ENK86_02770, partial [Campylobacterales bacterium]|nr:hypothetical protein [Campylobacterales bacterium]
MRKTVSLLLLFAWVVFAKEPNMEQIVLTTVEDQNITLTSTEKGIDFGIHHGKVVILDFLHTKCPPCTRGLEEMGIIQQKYP